MAVYDKPARYRLTRNAYIGEIFHVVMDGGPEVFVEYDGHPGTALEPTDAEGRRRQHAYFAMKRTTPAAAEQQKRALTHGAGDNGLLSVPVGNGPAPAAPAPPAAPVEIPEAWDKFGAGRLVLLAAKLGAPEACDTASEATKFIKDEIERRKAAGRGA